MNIQDWLNSKQKDTHFQYLKEVEFTALLGCNECGRRIIEYDINDIPNKATGHMVIDQHTDNFYLLCKQCYGDKFC